METLRNQDYSPELAILQRHLAYVTMRLAGRVIIDPITGMVTVARDDGENVVFNGI